MSITPESDTKPIKRKRGRPRKSEATKRVETDAQTDLIYGLLDSGNFGVKVAYKDTDGKSIVVRDRDGQFATRTAAGFLGGDPAKFIGGKAADNYRKAGEPQNVCTMLKRGRAETDAPAIIDRNGKSWSFRKMEILLVRSCLQHLEEVLGKPLAGVLITVPACYSDAERRASVELVETAGWTCIGLINEPSAAALGYGAGKCGGNMTILVVDIGGGTSDTTALRVQDGKTFTVLASRGCTDVAGMECTTLLRQHVMDELEKVGIPLDPETMQRDYTALEMACEEAKIDLSSQETVCFPVLVGAHRQDFTITREQFASIIAPVVEKIVQLIDDTLAQAGLTADKVDRVVRVGGSSCMPCVYDMLCDRFGADKVAGDIEPETAVVVGAGEAVGIKLEEKVASGDIELPGEIPEYLLQGAKVTDTVNFDTGVEAQSRRTGKSVFVPLIHRGTSLPESATRIFGLVEGSANAVIKVLEGNADEEHSAAKVLAEFSLSELPPGPDTNRIEISLDLSTDGVVNVRALDTHSGKEITATVDTVATVTNAG